MTPTSIMRSVTSMVGALVRGRKICLDEMSKFRFILFFLFFIFYLKLTLSHNFDQNQNLDFLIS